MMLNPSRATLHAQSLLRRELVLHAAFMAIFYCLARTPSVINHDTAWDGLHQLTIMVAPDLTGLGLLFLGLMLLQRIITITLIRFIQRFSIVFLYVLIIAQLRFEQETGMFFSADLANYTVENFHDLDRVIFGAGLDINLALLVIFSICTFLLAARPKPTRLTRYFSLTTVIIVYSITSYHIIHHVLTGKKTTPLSIVSALTKPGHWHDRKTPNTPIYPFKAPHNLATSSTRKPDILVIAIESARAMSTPGFSGNHKPAYMPTVSKLLPVSRIYTRAYTTTSRTSKALVGMLCGVSPMPGMEIKESREDGLPFPCLPRLLNSAGYRTVYFQSATEQFEKRRQLVANLGFSSSFYKEQIQGDFISSGYFGLDENALEEPFMAWWHASSGQPRFAFILTSTSHHPYEVPGKTKQIESDHQRYHETLSHTDALIGKLIAGLNASGSLTNTIVIITGDHGESFGEHRVKQHDAVPFEEGVRVPLLIHDGRNTLPHVVDNELRQHIDLAPTILRLADIQHDGCYPGIDLMNNTGHTQVITNCWYSNWCMSLIKKHEKWIYHAAEERIMMFNLVKDPAELDDIVMEASTQERSDVINTLLDHRASTTRMYLKNKNSEKNSQQ